MLQGDGVYIDKNSNRYEGQWRNDRAEGYGIKVFAKGDRHEGYYSNDKRNGFGTYYWANGWVKSYFVVAGGSFAVFCFVLFFVCRVGAVSSRCHVCFFYFVYLVYHSSCEDMCCFC